MQRPVMNPNLFEDFSAKPSQRLKALRLLLKLIWRPIRVLLSFLMYDPFSRIVGFRVEEGTRFSRFVRGLLYRLAFVPVFLAMSACAIVWVSTHPRTACADEDPTSQGIYYDAVNFVGKDNMRLEGWLVPEIDAKNVLEEQDQVLRTKHPAVVLVHDLGQRAEQMLPMIKPLHDAGFVVLAINLRGGGVCPDAGETFGLTESGDVKAAVEMLARRPFVDPKRIAVVGAGTGGTAALIAAESDIQIAAVVADHPVQSVDEMLRRDLIPQHAGLNWMSTLCKWTFEISYGVDAEDIDMNNFRALFDTRPVLMINPNHRADPSNSQTIDQVKSFLVTSMPAPVKHAVAEIK